MKIAIVLNRHTGQLDITWPNDEQHTYFVTPVMQAYVNQNLEVVEHEIRDAVADTMQDLLQRGLVRIAGYAVPDGRTAENMQRIQMLRYAPNTNPLKPGKNEQIMVAVDFKDPLDIKRNVVDAAAQFLARGEDVTIKCGDRSYTYRAADFQSRRRIFNEGAGDPQIGAGDLQLEGAGDLQLRSGADRVPVEIRHMPPTHDGDAWEITYSDGKSEIVRDACVVRSLAEHIFTRY